MASPSHRANIIAEKYDEIGVGIATGEFEGVSATFVVEMFGTPRITTSPEASTTQVVTSTQVRAIPVSDDVVRVSVKSDKPADTVVAQLAGEQISLDETEPGTWEGELSVNTRAVQENGEPLTAVFVNGEDARVEQLAYLSPGENTQRLYIFNEGTDRFVKLFNSFAIGNLEDKVQTFYLAFIAFLAAGIMAYLVMLKLRIHRPSIISHALTVLGLAIFLLLI
jgi:hypothetical protein